jgi:small-conductance mechanosensitive channel
MNKNLLSDLWTDVWTDLGLPGLRWQILTLVVCFALGWGLARLVRKLIGKREMQQDVMRIGVESFIRVLSPLLTLALIALAMPLLARFDRVDLLRVAIPLVGSFALIRLAFYIMRRVFAHRGQAGGFIALFEKTFALIVWIVVALHITGTLPDLLDFFDKTIVHFGRNKVSVLEILQAVLSVGVTLILALWAAALMEERLMRVDTMHSSLRVVMSRLGRAIFILIAVLVSLSLVGIDLTVLSVFGGALGVGLGLGLQKIASSYVSGFVILFERSLAIGDVVTVDKFSGRVTQINTRYTVLRGGDGGETVVPNEMFVSTPVQNFSLTDKAIQAVVRIIVDYRTDIDLALRLLEESTLDVDAIDRTLEHAPKALMIAFGTDGIELELSFWLADLASGKNVVLSDVNRAIWRAFQAHQINVPFPQREIRLVDEQSIAKKGDVNMPKDPLQSDSGA